MNGFVDRYFETEAHAVTASTTATATGIGTCTGTGIGTCTVTGIGTCTCTDTGTGIGTCTCTDTGTGIGTCTCTDTDTGTGIGTCTGTATATATGCIHYQIAYKLLVIITGAVQSEKEPLPSHAAGNRVLHHQMNSPLMLIESFLQALTNADKDGRIVIARKGTARY